MFEGITIGQSVQVSRKSVGLGAFSRRKRHKRRIQLDFVRRGSFRSDQFPNLKSFSFPRLTCISASTHQKSCCLPVRFILNVIILDHALDFSSPRLKIIRCCHLRLDNLLSDGRLRRER